MKTKPPVKTLSELLVHKEPAKSKSVKPTGLKFENSVYTKNLDLNSIRLSVTTEVDMNDLEALNKIKDYIAKNEGTLDGLMRIQFMMVRQMTKKEAVAAKKQAEQAKIERLKSAAWRKAQQNSRYNAAKKIVDTFEKKVQEKTILVLTPSVDGVMCTYKVTLDKESIGLIWKKSGESTDWFGYSLCEPDIALQYAMQQDLITEILEIQLHYEGDDDDDEEDHDDDDRGQALGPWSLS